MPSFFRLIAFLNETMNLRTHLEQRLGGEYELERPRDPRQMLDAHPPPDAHR